MWISHSITTKMSKDTAVARQTVIKSKWQLFSCHIIQWPLLQLQCSALILLCWIIKVETASIWSWQVGEADFSDLQSPSLSVYTGTLNSVRRTNRLTAIKETQGASYFFQFMVWEEWQWQGARKEGRKEGKAAKTWSDTKERKRRLR